MKDQELRFTGSVPENYDRLMVPLVFQPFADEIARRARLFDPRRILETAAGTGVVTKALHAALPEAEILATDLNPPMLDVAMQRVASDDVRFSVADAQDLPFDESTFDLAVCQFGAMFFPDKVRGHAEARRVLTPGGHYLLAIWADIGRNPLSNAVLQTLIDLFPENPPLFIREGPFGYTDPLRIETDLHDAGFDTVDIETVELTGRSPSAHEAASAFCYGTPMSVEVEERENGSLDRVFDAVQEAFRPFEGSDGVVSPMAAHIVLATK